MKIHIDIDCFFVSAARIMDHSLEHKPVAVGGRSDTKIFNKDTKKNSLGSYIDSFKDEDGRVRGILTTSSYEARAYGIKTAMTIREALQLCPHLIIKESNMSLYKELSHKLHNFLKLKIPLIEQASIDEFYGDVSGWVPDEEIPYFIDNLKHEIKKELKLPVSIGAAKTRYIAKLATTYAKPFGCKTVTEYEFDKFVNPIKVENFAGIGKSMKSKLYSVQIQTLGDLRARRGTIESWGPYAKELYKRVNGESDAPIKVTHQRKSIGISRTFDALYDRAEVQRRVHVLARHLSFAIIKLNVIPTVFHLSISYEMNQKSHKNISLAEIFTEKKFDALCLSLFTQADIHKQLKIAKLSINCSSFTKNSKKELSLIGFEDEQKMHKLTLFSQQLRERYGIDTLKFASEL